MCARVSSSQPLKEKTVHPTAQRQIPENFNIQQRGCQNLKSSWIILWTVLQHSVKYFTIYSNSTTHKTNGSVTTQWRSGFFSLTSHYKPVQFVFEVTYHSPPTPTQKKAISTSSFNLFPSFTKMAFIIYQDLWKLALKLLLTSPGDRHVHCSQRNRL